MLLRHYISAELTVIPIGTKSTSISKYIAGAVKALKELKNVRYTITPMGTVVEADDLTTLFEAMRKAHEAVFELGPKRVVTTITIDDRRDKIRKMEEKVKAVEEKLRS